MELPSVSTPPKKRRMYSPEFKAKILEACREPGASVAGVALSHGLNANLVHKWRRTAKQASATAPDPAFVPISLPAQTSRPAVTDNGAAVRIELPTHKGTVVVHWPVEQAERCLTWLRALMS